MKLLLPNIKNHEERLFIAANKQDLNYSNKKYIPNNIVFMHQLLTLQIRSLEKYNVL